MASTGDDSNDAVLSDVEDEDPVPVDVTSTSPEDVSVEKFHELLSELDRERQARQELETSKADLQVLYNRLKALAHEAIKKREESNRQKDEALREKDEALRLNEQLKVELNKLIGVRDDVMKQRDEALEKCDAAVKAKELLRSEVENGAQMLMSGIEKISGKVSSFKNFTAGGLPRSQKYTGLPAVSYGVIKRANEIVEELVRQIDLAAKSRNEAREQLEQRSYEIAIEVSQLEATIDGLKEEVSEKANAVENLEKLLREKDEKLSDVEKGMTEKQSVADNELERLRKLYEENEDKLRNLEAKMDSQRPLLVEQLNYVAKIHDQIDNVIKIVDANNLDHSELSESLFLPKETDMEENIRASLAGMASIHDLSRIVFEKTRELVEEKSNEVKRLNETVLQLVKEKEHIGTLLRSALSKRASADLSSKTNELFKVAENGLKEAGIDYKFNAYVGDGKKLSSNNKAAEDEIYTLAGALENIIKQSQIEIIELKHTVDELRAEASLLKQHAEAQSKELVLTKLQLEKLEEKERVANENVEGLMMDITLAEEEITRWKIAAEQEADAGKAVEQDLMAQLSVVRQELEEAKEAVIQLEKKVKVKEETADAAMAARDAAEKSLRLADTRSSRLRDKVEELTRQLETHESSRSVLTRPRYVCWPWEWLGLNSVGYHQSITNRGSSNEMELSEPLI